MPQARSYLMDSSELKRRSLRELVDQAAAAGVEGAAAMRRAELVVALLQVAARRGDQLTGDGVLEIMPDGFGFLRAPNLGYAPGADDVYVSPSQIRRFELRTGDTVGGVVRPPKEGERFVALLKVAEINGRPPEGRRPPLDFSELEVRTPSRWFELGGALGAEAASEPNAPPNLLRAIDLLAPLPAGGRALIAGPSGSGRSALLAAIARALSTLPDVAVHLLLVDQPREDLAELAARLPGLELVATSLDEPPIRHGQVADLALARSERLAESGRDVVLLVDSLSHLIRALHAALPARVVGTVDPTALHGVRRLFAAGRALGTGGSLTVIAIARTDGSELDQAGLDQLLPAASAVIRLDPALGPSGLLVDPGASHARRADRYLPADHQSALSRLRADLAPRRPAEAARRLAELIAAHPSNRGLLAALG